jgi:hypothetical protein
VQQQPAAFTACGVVTLTTDFGLKDPFVGVMKGRLVAHFPGVRIIDLTHEIPAHWPKAYGLDVGWNKTAAPFGALDRENDVLYIYSCHYQGQQEPSTHVAAIRARGEWIPGTIDPASRGRSQKDGEQLLQIYRDLGLTLTPAENSVESGLFEVHQRLATGRLKVFRSCKAWFGEYRIYHRDEKGHIVKANDHLMDGTRYLVVTGIHLATTNASQSAAKYRALRGLS